MSISPEAARERLIYLYPGELTASRIPSELTTVVGSCVAVFLWDARRRQGGMNHFLLPRQPRGDQPSARFGVPAIHKLIEILAALGSDPSELVAKVFGGAQVLGPPRNQRHLGLQNVEVAFETLHELRLAVLASDVGGNRGRRVVAHTEDGSAWVKEL
jgi:chemotaxis protein CheD